MKVLRLACASVLVFGLLGSAVSGIGARVQVDDETGRAAFVENECARCHSVESQHIEATASSERMRGPDLSQVGQAHDADWIVGFVKRELTGDDDVRHRVPFRGSDEDLRTVAEWLSQLK